MKFIETGLDGAYIVELEELRDDRGFFARAWCAGEFKQKGLSSTIVQANVSYNREQGTLRGMHYQLAPHEETKLVRCIRGALYDVIIDLRIGSTTYCQHAGVELSAENRRMLYVPEGFAHGFQTLENDTEAFYQVSEFYTPGVERGVRYDDPRIGIRWPVPVKRISEKDATWPDFED